MGRPSTAVAAKVASAVRTWTQRWFGTGAGASVPVKTNGTGTLTRQGVGLYTMTFGDVGGKMVDGGGTSHTLATVAPQYWKLVAGSMVTATKSVQLECWSAAGILVDPPAAALVSLAVEFLDNATDNS